MGISEDIGHGMTFLILTQNDKVIARSIVRSALKGGVFDNKRAQELGPDVAPTQRRLELLSPFTDDDKVEVTPSLQTADQPMAQFDDEDETPISSNTVSVETVEQEDGENLVSQPTLDGNVTEMFSSQDEEEPPPLLKREPPDTHPDWVHSSSEWRGHISIQR